MSFQIALSGLNAASTDLQVTSNNVANANTIGFKSSRAEFADVFSGDAVGIGNGVRLSDVRQEFTQGNVEITSRQLDLAISGNGFFITEDDGTRLYSRVGAFGLDADGIVQNAEGERLQIYTPVPSGGFNQGDLSDLVVTSETAPPVASTTVDMNINLPANAPLIGVAFDPNNPATYNHSTSTILYDSLGAAHTATYFFSRTGAGWLVNMTFDGTQANLPPGQPFTFNTTGTIDTPAGGTITFPTIAVAGANNLDVALQLGNTTQYGANFTVNSVNPDGQAEGRLRGIEIDQTGVVFARFSNGQSLTLGKVALANFSNPEGLQKISDTSFQETFGSGNAQTGEASESNFGLIQSGALETSNVDLTEQLVRLITAQRLFQANAQVISTQDTITQTIINIR
jgi:flagellar hook protein FlgE